MATKDSTPPEGFTRVDSSGSDDGEQYETKELGPGESLQGRVIDILEGEGDYGPWYRLRLINTETGEIFNYFAEDGAKKAVTEGDVVEGDEVYIEKDVVEEEYSVNGREGTYHPVGIWTGGA